jgi:hypothetical protein
MHLVELYGDCAARLWHAARPLVDGVLCCRDKEASTVIHLLAALHLSLEAIDYEDALLRCSSDPCCAIL